MNLHTFEKSQNDSSSLDEIANLKQKIEKRKEKQKKVKSLFIALILLVVVLGVLFGYSQYKLYLLSKAEVLVTSQGETATSSSALLKPKTGEEVIASLKRHILVPSGNPQIAEVQDVAKLKETQAFFKDAENGDIVLVYETMIFIYRPSSDIVIAASDISGVGQKKP
jgi:hypothetical protein